MYAVPNRRVLQVALVSLPVLACAFAGAGEGEEPSRGLEWSERLASARLRVTRPDSRGLEITVALDRKEYLPGERITYRVTLANGGTEGIGLEDPLRRDQMSGLVFFVQKGNEWLARKPAGYGPPSESTRILQPGKSMASEGVLHEAVEGLSHAESDTPLRRGTSASYSVRVWYVDRHTPRGEAARSNTVVFTVTAHPMTSLRNLTYVRQVIDRSDGHEKTVLMAKRSFSLLVADEERSLLYRMTGYGLVRLGVLVDQKDADLAVDSQGNVHALWRMSDTSFGHAVFEDGLPSAKKVAVRDARDARLRETSDGRVTVATRHKPE